MNELSSVPSLKSNYHNFVLRSTPVPAYFVCDLDWLLIAGRGPDGGKEVSARRRVSAAKLETYRLWYDDGLSMEAVAEARSIKTSTALQYITGLFYSRKLQRK